MYLQKSTLFLVLLVPFFALVSCSCSATITQSQRSLWTSDQSTYTIYDVTITNAGDSPILSLVITTGDRLYQYWNMNPVLQGLAVPSYVTGANGLAVTNSYEWGYIIDKAAPASFTIQDISCSASGPSQAPSPAPNQQFPTQNPTQAPSQIPSQSPTQAPSQAPSQSPTWAPSGAPTQGPPSPTQVPTQAPVPSTQAPTQQPSQPPSQAPSTSPTQWPTQNPTGAPSQAPTSTPTQPPIPATQSPTQFPSQQPSQPPSGAPTQTPSQSPTSTPSQAPTQPPSGGGGGASIPIEGWVDIALGLSYPPATPQTPVYTGSAPSSGFCTGTPKRYNGKLCATTTRYYDGQMGACGCGTGDQSPFPFQWQTYTAAASPPIYGYTSWCGRGCGKCFNITTTGYSPNGKGATPGQSIVVAVTNLCPPQDPWCANGLTSYNYLGHFDLMDLNMNGIISQLGWDNPEVYFDEIPCTGQTPYSTQPSSIAQCQCH